MRSLSLTRFSLWAIAVIILFSCNKKDIFTTEPLSDYLPTVVGKYITYRIDSTVFTNFGRNTEIHKYQIKHVIEAQITDNLGQTTYRVFTYQRDSAGTQPWQATSPDSYFITPYSDRIEVKDENNLRFIKLHLPVKNGNSWKGNKYLPHNPYELLYNFSNDDYMEDWDFYFDGASSSFSYRGQNYSDVYSIEEVDEFINVPIINPNDYASKNRAVEKYSKNIGLVYREYEMWEYQPNPSGQGGPYKTGFGIRMWMIDHN